MSWISEQFVRIDSGMSARATKGKREEQAAAAATAVAAAGAVATAAGKDAAAEVSARKRAAPASAADAAGQAPVVGERSVLDLPGRKAKRQATGDEFEGSGGVDEGKRAPRGAFVVKCAAGERLSESGGGSATAGRSGSKEGSLVSADHAFAIRNLCG